MLQFAIYTALDGILIADWTLRVTDLVFATNQHGFESLQATIPISWHEALILYNQGGARHVAVHDGGQVAWEGRLEDPTLWVDTNGAGLKIKAFGYQRALTDTKYTALWSTTALQQWSPAIGGIPGTYEPSRYSMTNTNRLYITPKAGESFNNVDHLGALGLDTPTNGQTSIGSTDFSYTLVAPTGWTAEVFVANYDATSVVTVWSLGGNGGTQSGSTSVTTPARVSVFATIYYNSTISTALPTTTHTDDIYLSISAIRVRGTTSTTVYSDAIVRALIDTTVAQNPFQLNSSKALVQAGTLDLTDEIYQDQTPAQILDHLAALGDNSLPPRMWEWQVWEDQVLAWRPRGSAGRNWYVDASRLEVQRSLDQLANALYATYQGGSNRTLRTTIHADANSVAHNGITRQASVNVQSTYPAVATITRDAKLADSAEPLPRAEIRFDTVFTAQGARVPGWWVRAGDTITIRNLPPTFGNSFIDKLRTFRISRTEYDVLARALTVEPDAALPSLDVQFAQFAAGYRGFA